MLILKDINFKINNRIILQNLNLHAQKGKLITIVGPNGAGKSTLLEIIAGFLKLHHSKSKIILDETNITKQSRTERSHHIAKMMQNTEFNIVSELTIFENIILNINKKILQKSKIIKQSLFQKIFYNFNCYNKANRNYAQQILTEYTEYNTELKSRMDEQVSNLSGGQKQTLSLAMILMSQPKVILMDEITSALDPETAQMTMKILLSVIQKYNIIGILVTHNIEHAIKYGDQTMILQNHKLEEFKA